MFKRVFFFYAPDNGGGSGGGGGGDAEGEPKTGEGEGTGAGGSDNGTQDNGTKAGQGNGTQKTGSEEGDKGKKVEFTAEQQKEVDRIAAKSREDGKKAAEKKASDEKLKTQGEYQKLHADLEATVEKDLKPKAALADELTSKVNQLLDGEVKAWPDSLKKQDPGADDVRARMKWVENSRDLAAELLSGRKAPNGEHGKGSGGKGTETQSVLSVVQGRYAKPGGSQATK